jgi:hypothetical protein
MNVKTTLTSELTKLAAGGFPSGPYTLCLDTPAGRLTAELLTVDRLACTLQSLSLDSSKLAGASLEALKQLSGTLSKQLCYLLEPISLVECDADSATVQLRSSPPAKDDDQTSYYEVVAKRGGSITLCRYLKLPGDVRQITPATLTHEVLARLGEDFVAALP